MSIFRLVVVGLVKHAEYSQRKQEGKVCGIINPAVSQGKHSVPEAKMVRKPQILRNSHARTQISTLQ